MQQHNDVVAGVDELLWLQAALLPRLEILFLKNLDDLGKTVSHAPFFEPADGAVELNLRIDQPNCAFLIPAPERLDDLPHNPHVPCDIA